MAIITIPGITDECEVYHQTEEEDNFVFANTAKVTMRLDVYTHYRKHDCAAFILLDTREKRTHIRYNTPIDKIFGIFYKHWRLGDIGDELRVHQFQVGLRLRNAQEKCIKLVGGFLLGFESEEDAVIFKLKYL